MASNFGTFFRVSTFGESHGVAIGCIVDGCPPMIPLTEDDLQKELDRRRPGQSKIVTQRKEADTAQIQSGVLDGQTLGTPISVVVLNQDQRSDAYKEMQTAYRPSHADYTYDSKYGVRAVAGGGRSSARETIGRVAAGAIARKVLNHYVPSYECLAYVRQVGDVVAEANLDKLTLADVESNIVRACDDASAEKMIELIENVRSQGDSIGGVIECVVRNVPVGLGEPVFDKLEAELAKAMLSLPATKGFEIGSGFAGVSMKGSEHNDIFYRNEHGQIRTKTNRSGGIQGGISNGEDIVFRVAFKPTATILREQDTVDSEGNATVLKARGRHDACVLPRAVPIVEAMVHLVVVDHFLRQRALKGA